ncbi:MAG: hypothetical protein PHE88_08965 [Elusimicrobia bacterium]|nr:hypothetical protein [Elusimicrobiota bacterium]
MKRSKLFFLLVLLSTTCFIKGCSLYNAKFSCGFVLPYFDILVEEGGGFYFSQPYNIFVSLIINLIAFFPIFYYIRTVHLIKSEIFLRKIYKALLLNIVLFNLSLLIYYVEIYGWIAAPYIILPNMGLCGMLTGHNLNDPCYIVIPRLYFLITTAIIFYIIPSGTISHKKTTPKIIQEGQREGNGTEFNLLN